VDNELFGGNASAHLRDVENAVTFRRSLFPVRLADLVFFLRLENGA